MQLTQPNAPVRKKLPKLTITMATVNDYDGVYFTIQGIRNHHDCSEIEFVVVDNKPDSPSSQQVAGFVQGMARAGTAGAKYIPLTLPKGTAPPRDLAIRSATSDYVLQVDSHILLRPGALDAILAYWEKNPNSQDIISGPLVMDDFKKCFTHFDMVWRSEMWGVWGSAWACSCYNPHEYNPGKEPLRFALKQSAGQPDSKAPAEFVGLHIEQVPVNHCPRCAKMIPQGLLVGNHHARLRQEGYQEIGYVPGEQAFEIPAQGLGLFSVRRDSWLGFNPHFRGFGGEEGYIHAKYQQAGRRAMCLPDLKWVHRFGRPNGVQYPLSKYLKVRNYVLGFQELGMDLAPIEEHFVNADKGLPRSHWEHLLADPIKHENEPDRQNPVQVSLAAPPTAMVKTLDDLYSWTVANSKRDLHVHLPKLAEFAAKCEHVTELGRQRESAIALARGCKKLVSFNAEAADALLQLASHITPEATIIDRQHQLVDDIEETDMLFLDATATFDAIKGYLEKLAGKVKHFIVVHRSRVHGEIGENSMRGGVRTALRAFMQKSPQWSVIFHSNDGNGLTILSCKPEDKPALPSFTQMASNFLGSMASFVSDGARLVDKELYEARLLTCSDCPHRNGNSCSVCGCGLAAKAQVRADGCPLGFWPDQKPKA